MDRIVELEEKLSAANNKSSSSSAGGDIRNGAAAVTAATEVIQAQLEDANARIAALKADNERLTAAASAAAAAGQGSIAGKIEGDSESSPEAIAKLREELQAWVEKGSVWEADKAAMEARVRAAEEQIA